MRRSHVSLTLTSTLIHARKPEESPETSTCRIAEVDFGGLERGLGFRTKRNLLYGVEQIYQQNTFSNWYRQVDEWLRSGLGGRRSSGGGGGSGGREKATSLGARSAWRCSWIETLFTENP